MEDRKERKVDKINVNYISIIWNKLSASARQDALKFLILYRGKD